MHYITCTHTYIYIYIYIYIHTYIYIYIHIYIYTHTFFLASSVYHISNLGLLGSSCQWLNVVIDGLAAPMAAMTWQWLCWLSLVAAQRPICQMSDAFAASVDMHLSDWDSQIDFALNESLNCSDFLEYVYLSRDRIRAQLDYVADEKMC